MRKTIIMVILVAAVMLAGCSDLFRQIKDSNLKTGNDKISSNQGTGGLNLDAGLVVQTPNDPDYLGNRIDFYPDQYSYQVDGLGTEDSPIKFVCRPEDPNAVVTWEFLRIEDENGVPLPNPVKITPESVEMTDDGSVAILTSANDPGGYLYGTVRATATITADDPQYSRNYTIDLNRTDTLVSAIEFLTVTPENNSGLETSLKEAVGDDPENIENYNPKHHRYRIDADEDADYLDIDLQTYDGADVSWVIKDKEGNTTGSGTDIPFKVDDLGLGYYQVIINVTEAGQASVPYILNVFRPRDNLTSLKSLEFDALTGNNDGIGILKPEIAGNVAPDIEKDDDNYSIWVSSYYGNDVTSLLLKPVPGHKYASILSYSSDHGSISGPDSNGYGEITDLPKGDTDVTIRVRAKDGTENDHILTIHKTPEDSTALHSLVVTAQESAHLTEINKTSTVVGVPIADAANYYSPHAYNDITAVHGTYLLKQETTEANITVITFNEGATVSASSSPAVTVTPGAGGLFSVAGLPDGTTTVTFTVTAEDPTTTTRDFNVVFTKPTNTNGKIRQMNITQGFLNADPYPASVSDEYTIYVNADTDQLDLVIDRFVHDSAEITGCSAVKTHEVDGTPTSPPDNVSTSFDATNKSAVFGGTGTDALPAGTTEVTLTTKNGSGPTETYTIVIVKPAANESRLKAFGAYEVNKKSFDGFDRDTYIGYEESIESPSSVTFFAESIYDNANITLTVSHPSLPEDLTVDSTDGNASLTINNPQVSGIDYHVQALVSDGINTKTYEGDVAITLPDIRTLKSLTVEQGAGDETKNRPVSNFTPNNDSTTDPSTYANVSLGYETALKVYPVPTDSEADLVFGPVVVTGDPVTSSWDGSAFTITDYAKADTITIPITVVSQAQNSLTYNLHVVVSPLEESDSYTTENINIDSTTREYNVGTFGTNLNQMGYRFGSKLTKTGASPQDTGGMDIVGKLDGEDWSNTSFQGGGWHYKLKAGAAEGWVHIPDTYDGNSYINETTTGLQFKLGVKIMYANGVPYAEITHTVRNNSGAQINNISLGASSDILVDGADIANPSPPDLPLEVSRTNYGFKAVGGSYTFGIYCRNPEWTGNNRSVSTFWAGQFGYEDENVFKDNTITGEAVYDDAAAYSWNIGNLAAGAEVSRIIRISLGLLGEQAGNITKK